MTVPRLHPMHSSAPLAPGKLDPAFLQQLLGRLPRDERVIVGPGLGQDAAVVELGDRCLVLSTDPITLTGRNLGWYLVHVNANDVACMGARPRWFLGTVLFPLGTSGEQVARLYQEIADACQKVGVVPVGGHTEITGEVSRPVATGIMVGEVAADKVVQGGGIQEGDSLLLTRGVAIEGTHVLFTAHEARLRRAVPETLVNRMARLLEEPGISVVREALTAVDTVEVHAMHDPTEGGVSAGLWELAQASEVRLEVARDLIPVREETRAACRALGLDPLRLLASGCLLLAVPPGEVTALGAAYAATGVEWAQIGKAFAGPPGVWYRTEDGIQEVTGPFADELHRLDDTTRGHRVGEESGAAGRTSR